MECAVWAQTVVLTATLLVVCWYAFETHRFRSEMVRQNNIALRPIVLPHFPIVGGVRTFHLRNCGVGCALNVRVSPVRIPNEVAQAFAPGDCELRFQEPYYMESREDLAISYSIWAGGQHVANRHLQDWFLPDRITRRVSFGIKFDDVEGQAYEIPVTIEGTSEEPGIPRRVVIGAIHETDR